MTGSFAGSQFTGYRLAKELHLITDRSFNAHA
jgi:hypothetical protein